VSPFIQQSDVDAATAELERRLEAALQSKVQDPGAAVAGSQLLAEGARMGEAAFDPDPATLVGREQIEFSLVASGTGTALSVNAGGVRELAEARLGKATKSGFGVVGGSGSATILESEPVGNGFSVTFEARGMQAPVVDEAKLKAAIGGLAPADAEAYLSRYGTAEVRLWPFWVSSVPDFLDFRIEIQVLTPTTSPSPKPAAGSAPVATTASPATASP
jgi:hypothetical protein